jgi:hypothetical protein
MARGKQKKHGNEKKEEEHTEKLLNPLRDDEMNASMESDSGLRFHLIREQQRRKAVWCSFISVGLGLVVLVGAFAILKVSKQANEIPTKKPVFPRQYEASLTFRMPYMNLVEPVFAHVDEVAGLQKLSYYGGPLRK